jgi:hypothetical protein
MTTVAFRRTHRIQLPKPFACEPAVSKTLAVSDFALAGSCVIADANLRVLSQHAVGKTKGV